MSKMHVYSAHACSLISSARHILVLNFAVSYQRLLWLADLAQRVLKKLRLKEKQTSKGASKAGQLSQAVQRPLAA